MLDTKGHVVDKATCTRFGHGSTYSAEWLCLVDKTVQRVSLRGYQGLACFDGLDMEVAMRPLHFPSAPRDVPHYYCFDIEETGAAWGRELLLQA